MTSGGEAETAAITTVTAAPPLLEVRGASKQFGATRALDDVSLRVGRGEIVALLGENGAGKSTLIKALAGVHALDSGSIRYRGQDHPRRPARHLPIAFIHQDLGLIEWMTVAENICLALGYPRRLGLGGLDMRRGGGRRRHWRRWAPISTPMRAWHSLSRTEKSLVAISRALAAEVELLVLDEPTASLPANEVARLFASLRRLRARGVGHDLRLAPARRGVRDRRPHRGPARRPRRRRARGRGHQPRGSHSADRRPRTVAGVSPAGAARRFGAAGTGRRLASAMSGRSTAGCTRARSSAWSACAAPGQESVGRALFGLAPLTPRPHPAGRPSASRRPRRARRCRQGINLVCADRMADSVVPNLSVRENLFLNPLAAGFACVFRPFGRPASIMPRSGSGRRSGLRPNDPALPIEWLSGGNQQKVVVGRWLHLQSKVYIFEDPTAGVDVGAKAEIYRLFDVALKRGAAILLVSTDFEEVEKVCHRALVFDRGRVVAELGVGDMSAENLLAAASASIGQVAEALTRIEPDIDPIRPAMQSLKSNALEPTRSELAGLTRWRAAARILPIYGLPILALVLAVFFSILLPDSFPTALNVRSILSDKGIIALLSLGAMLPMMAGRIDLTIGFGIVLWHILAISLQVWYHVPWPLAILLVSAVQRLWPGWSTACWSRWRRSTASSPRLGTGTILYALALWLSGGRQVMGHLGARLHRRQRAGTARDPDAGRLCDRARRAAFGS